MKYFLFLSFSLVTYFSFGQCWEDMMLNPEKSIHEIHEAFEMENNSNNNQKGQGLKQYKRWENFWEPRLYPSGVFNQKSLSVNDFLENQFLNKSNNYGDWESLGLDTWTSGSYGPGNGRVNCIYRDPLSQNVIYLGSASGGLWKSIDFGDSWNPLTDNLPSLGVSGIAVDYNDQNVVYIATGDGEHQDVYGVGVLKSIDGGVTWNATGLTWDITDNKTCIKLLMHPTNAQILYCATNSGLFKTENGGLSWNSVLSGVIYDVELKPTDPNIVYATKERLYKSIDAGDDFTLVSGGVLPVLSEVTLAKIAVTPANPEVVYLFCSNIYYGFQGLYKSIDSGESWVLQSNSPNVLASDSSGGNIGGQAWYDMAIAVSNTDENVVIVGGVNLWKSINGGTNWSLNSYWYLEGGMTVNYVHADIHYLGFDGDDLFCGSDGGIFVSSDDSESYDDISSGLVISQFTKLGVSSQNSSLLIAGAQDNGSNIYRGAEWRHVNGADGGECLFHPTDSNIVFCSTQNGGIRKSINGGEDFTPSVAGISEEGPWVTPFMISPLNSDFMYTGMQNVWRSTNLGESWARISEIYEPLTSVMVGMSDPNTVYASSLENLYKTNDGGGNWENISLTLPNTAITDIAVDPLDLDRVWVTFSGFGECCKVYYSDNGGGDWINITDNLPNFPVNCILFDDQGQNGIYIGTDNGIYYTNDNLAHWESFMNNLPNVIVTELEIHNDDQQIFASTFGRGVWKSSIWENSENPIVNFSASQAICEGESLSFEDLSSLAEPGWLWSFEGADVVSSTEENPVVTYSSEGVYDVSLVVSNSNGESSYTCEDCVHVYANQGQSLPLIENFDDENTLIEMEWFTEDEFGWQISNEAAFSGIHSMWIDNYQLNTNDNYEIYSKPIYLSVNQAFLYFKYSYGKVDESNNDKLRLYTSIDCGATWSLKNVWSGSSSLISSATSLEAYFPESNTNWNEGFYEFNGGILDEEMMFKFKFENDGGNNIFIDDINITSQEISVPEQVKKSDISIYPNPANDELVVILPNTNLLTFVIFNSLGQKVDSFSSKSKLTINVSNYSEGLYFYSVLNNNLQVETGEFQVIH